MSADNWMWAAIIVGTCIGIIYGVCKVTFCKKAKS